MVVKMKTPQQKSYQIWQEKAVVESELNLYLFTTNEIITWHLLMFQWKLNQKKWSYFMSANCIPLNWPNLLQNVFDRGKCWGHFPILFHSTDQFYFKMSSVIAEDIFWEYPTRLTILLQNFFGNCWGHFLIFHMIDQFCFKMSSVIAEDIFW